MFHWKNNCLIYLDRTTFCRKCECSFIENHSKVRRIFNNDTGQERAVSHSTKSHSTLYSTVLSFLIGLLVFCVSCHLTAIIPGKSIFVCFCFDRFNKFYFVCFLFIIKVLRKGQSKGQN